MDTRSVFFGSNIPHFVEYSRFTVGYAGHDRDSLLALFRAHGITAVADIRTFKRSSYWTAFDADSFGPFLRENGIAYVFMGDVMGGKPQIPELYPDGQLDYGLMAARPDFKSGIERLVSGAKKYRICLMCAWVVQFIIYGVAVISNHRIKGCNSFG